MITPDELRPIALFAGLDVSTLAEIARAMQICEYRAGDYLAYEGEHPPGILYVARGRVRLSRSAADGREQVLAMIGTGESLHAVAVFDQRPSPTSARAMSPVRCLLLPRDQLLHLLRHHPDLAIAALRDLAGQLRDLVVLVDDLAFRSVRARLARQLLHEAAEGPAEMTQQELAERAGTVREIAGRALRQLAAEGIVRLARGRVSVLDPARLAALIEE